MNNSDRDAAPQGLTTKKRRAGKPGLVRLSEILPEVLESLGAAAYTDDPRQTYAYLLEETGGLPPDSETNAVPAPDEPYERDSHKDVGGWYAGSFGWPASEAGSSLMEERARRKNLTDQWLTRHKKPLTAAREKRLCAPTEILRSTAEGDRAAAVAEVERVCGFRGRPSANWDASNSLDLADQELDRLALEREEYRELEQTQSQQQSARVAA